MAKLVSQKQGLGLTDRQFVAMVTSNPAMRSRAARRKAVGRIMPGGFGDITVFRPSAAALLESALES